ncbi:MAG: hypothetical protein ABI639_10260 [Thermoanaerobaculia bacterium]
MGRLNRMGMFCLFAALAFNATVASAQVPISNAEFDLASVAGWTGELASVFWSQSDPDCDPPNASGSMAISPEVLDSAVSTIRCVDAPSAATVNFSAQILLSCQSRVDAILDFYPQALCGGVSLQTSSAGATVASGSWLELAVPAIAVPAGTVSVRIKLQVSESVSAGCDTNFDQIFLGAGSPILRGGFETGSSACRWSATFP